MTSPPLISVCIPAYNNEDFIAATLGSVLKQTCGDFEIVITDDCSTDATVSVIAGFSDPRIRLLENPANLGIGRNWNKALAQARGKYLKVLCGDDVLYPDCLRRQVDALENSAHSDIVLAVCGSDVINETDGIILRRRGRLGTGRQPGKRIIAKCVRWGANLIGEPAVGLFRRDVLARSAAFDPANPYMLDVIFWAEVLKHGDAFIDPNRLAAFRLSARSVTSKLGHRQAEYTRAFVRTMRDDPVYRARPWDVFSGYCFASPRWILRHILSRFFAAPKLNS